MGWGSRRAQWGIRTLRFLMSLVFVVLVGLRCHAADWPMFGRDATRNPVSRETGPPTDWDIGKFNRRSGEWEDRGHNVRWHADLGYGLYASPVIADGLVWIGANRTSTDGEQTDAALLRCFRESDGELLYEFASPRLEGGTYRDPPWHGLPCSPSIAGDRLWCFTNRCEVICLDIGPLKRSEGEPVLLWTTDLKALGIHLRPLWMWPGRISSVSQPYEGKIYLTVPNGVDESFIKVPAPQAPSLACLDAATGEVIWTDNTSSENMLYSEFSSPLVVEIEGRGQVIVAQGDGWVRSFEPATGELNWEFDANAKTSSYIIGGGNRNYFLATPVLYENRVYVASGQQANEGSGPGRLLCLDPTRTGDISAELATDLVERPAQRRRFQAVNPDLGEKVIPNPNSGLIWEYGGPRDAFEDEVHRAIASVAIKDGLLVLPDFSGLVHCFDARTGERLWHYDCFGEVWGSPLIVDDLIYVANIDGIVSVLRLSREPDVAMDNGSAVFEINLGSSCTMSPVFANGALYLCDRYRLYAIAEDGGPEEKTERQAALGSWPQWRGPNRDNRSSETGLLSEWPKGGPPLQYRVEGLGEGIASVAISDGRILTTTYKNGIEYVVCLEQRSGRLRWATPIGAAVRESRLMRWLSQRCPTIDGERLYVLSAEGELICLASEDGREHWRKNYRLEFQGRRGWWGFCDYPLVDGDRLICTPAGDQATVVALDKRTGELLWKCAGGFDGENHTANAFAATVRAEFCDVSQYVTFVYGALLGVAADDGRLLWKYDRFHRDQSALTPVVIGNELVCAGGHGNYGVARLGFTPGEPQWQVTEKYYSDVVINHFQDNLIHFGDHLFATSRIGPLCLDIRNGESAWQQPPRWSSIVQPSGDPQRLRSSFVAAIYADDRFYLRDSSDMMMLADVKPTGLNLKGAFQLPDPQRATGATTPVIAGGNLYIRDDDRLFCYDIRQAGKAQPAGDGQLVRVELPSASDDLRRQAERGGSRSVFVPTPDGVVDQMLKLAGLAAGERFYDLGSGDGRLVIKAAKDYDAEAVGIEIDRELVEISRKRAVEAGVNQLTSFRQGDIFEADFTDADVVAVYLLPNQLGKLTDKLQQLASGTRIVSHQFRIPGIEHTQQITVRSEADGTEHDVFLYRVPLQER